MQSSRSLVAQLEHCLTWQGLLNGETPLLDVLCRTVGIGGSEADRRLTQHGRAEVKPGQTGNKVVALVCFRKHQRRNVTLVAEGVHIDRREEDAVSTAHHKPQTSANLVRKTHAGRKVVLVGIDQPTRHA